MPKKNPPHRGELIGDNFAELDVSIVEAAKALCITRQQLHNLIAGRSAITPEMAVKLEMAIGGAADACFACR
jgi:antitoxin HigA-1